VYLTIFEVLMERKFDFLENWICLPGKNLLPLKSGEESVIFR